jgi:hypothetical protein
LTADSIFLYGRPIGDIFAPGGPLERPEDGQDLPRRPRRAPSTASNCARRRTFKSAVRDDRDARSE